MSASEEARTRLASGTIELGEDFESHRITGYVPHAANRGMSPDLDVPLISHVEGRLWQGGSPEYFRVDLPEGFDYVLDLYPWGPGYCLPDGCERDRVRMYDSLDQTLDQVEELAQGLKNRLDAGETVLVHCQAGLNRSGLLAARTLMLLGYSADAAIAKLREGRDEKVLCNDTFENYLRAIEGAE